VREFARDCVDATYAASNCNGDFDNRRLLPNLGR
jgi:hypothetical protein